MTTHTARGCHTLTTLVAKFIYGQSVPVYGFYTFPVLRKVDNHETLVFTCTMPTCQHNVNMFTSTKDFGSTGNLQQHMHCCHGVGHLNKAQQAGKASIICASLAADMDGTITLAFGWMGKNRVKYSMRSLTDTQARYVSLTCCMPASRADFAVDL